MKSDPAFDKHWGFKVQTTLSSSKAEKFILQDVEGFYKRKQFRLNFGQFVPHYSLQRFQHDYSLAFAERFSAINTLIPNGTLGVRDIGIEGNWRNNKNSFRKPSGGLSKDRNSNYLWLKYHWSESYC